MASNNRASVNCFLADARLGKVRHHHRVSFVSVETIAQQQQLFHVFPDESASVNNQMPSVIFILLTGAG